MKLISPHDNEGDLVFVLINHEKRDEWNAKAKAGNVLKVDFADGSILLLPDRFDAEDLQFLKEAFWSQRWQRWSEGVWVKLFIVFGVPLMLLGGGLAVGSFRKEPGK